ncbi:GIY-YIG nuclease family protein [Thiohalobacter sp. IOR34]|uniref:GIY-YIG nuclease family protein n=1 Tax=Thiohalobacter sp. IOR34 TaxID=3057176 RepID=UPI0025B05E60|nr:GIY-YIG nuclease family protein [Thiohalobacter sp. IOR34]WJW76248.1 GIY-YIG nuclease family protein [Thiohalobacter sp. IOR34]
MGALPSLPGSYVLLLHLAQPRQLIVGRLGEFDFEAGWYLYVGSAQGPGGLAARVGHHLQGTARPRWHIDYLRAAARLQAVWYSAEPRRREDDWAALVSTLPGARVPVPGFGASDSSAASHLLAFRRPPAFQAFVQRLHRRCPGHAPLHCYRPGLQAAPRSSTLRA